MKLFLTLDETAHKIILDDERSLSAPTRKALESAVGSGAFRKVFCSRMMAEEIRDWFGQVASGRLHLEGIQSKSPVCRRAEKAITATLLATSGVHQVRRRYMTESGRTSIT